MLVVVTEQMIKQRDHQGWQTLPDTWPTPLKKVFAARGISAEADLYFALADLPKPQQLLGMEQAVSLLVTALQQNQHIMIVADFDADGATSCAVAIRGLKAMGAKNVSYIVPNRIEHGYGLTPALLDSLITEQVPDLLITVDNGIASIEGVNAAHEWGMKVIITDHHLPGEQLPAAEAIVNPNQVGDNFPSKHMAGVGVCFYLLLALRQRLRELAWFEQAGRFEPNLMQLIDLVALGTIADVVKLDQLNRTWVELGLARIRAGKACTGIHALLMSAGKSYQQCCSSDLSFYVAPKLNAAGRMQDMRIGIETLLTDDTALATNYAQQLNQINATRRDIEQTMQQEALVMLDTLTLQQDELPSAYCLFENSWHQGIVGLLASRIKDKVHRPVIAFAPSDDGFVKGSARSIPGIHIRDVLARIAVLAPTVLNHFGGHAMAAGLTIKQQDLTVFENYLQQAIDEMYPQSVFDKEILSDGELAATDINLNFAEQLPTAAPWGQGFNEPRFHGKFMVDNIQLMGQQQNHLKLTVSLDDGRIMTAIAFNTIQPDFVFIGSEVLLSYRLSVNEFRQQKTVQLLVDELLESDRK